MGQQEFHDWRQSGFTLIEVLIAVAIFTVGILAVNAMQISALKGNSTAYGISESTYWAASRLETLLGLDYDDAALDDTDGDGTDQDANYDGVDDNGGEFGLGDADPATADGSAVSPDGQFTIMWNVALEYPFPHTKTIRIIVSRQDRGVTKTVPFTYIKAEKI